MTDIFKSKMDVPTQAAKGDDIGIGMVGNSRQEFPAGSSVAVAMTCDEQRNVMRSNYPRYSALDVEHVRRPRFGKGM